MNKKAKYLLTTAGAMCCIGWGICSDGKAKAIDRNKVLPKTTVVRDTTEVSGDYSFVFKWIPGVTTMDTFNHGRGNWNKEKYIFDNEKICYGYLPKGNQDKGKFGATYHNVGHYGGKTIDLKITVLDWKNSCKTLNRIVYCGEGNIGHSMQGYNWVKQNWEFVDHQTGKPVNISGYVNITDMDFKQAVAFDKKTSDHISNVLVTDDSVVYSRKDSQGEEEYYDGKNSNLSPKDKFGQFTILYRDLDGLTFKWMAHHWDNVTNSNTTFKDNTEGDYFGYNGKKLAKTELVTPEKYIQNGQDNVTQYTMNDVNQKLNYNLYAKVSDENPEFRYKSYELEDNVPDCLKIENARLLDESNRDASNKFDNQSKGNRLLYKAKASALNSANFYNHEYHVQIRASVNKAKLDKYLNGNIAEIHNRLTARKDGKKKPSNDTTVRITRRLINVRHFEEQSDKTLKESREYKYDGENYAYDKLDDLTDGNNHLYRSDFTTTFGIVNGKDIRIEIPYHLPKASVYIEQADIETTPAEKKALNAKIRLSAREEYPQDFEKHFNFKLNIIDTDRNKTVYSQNYPITNLKNVTYDKGTTKGTEMRKNIQIPLADYSKGHRNNLKFTITFPNNPDKIITETQTDNFDTYGYTAAEKTLDNSDLKNGDITYTPVASTTKIRNGKVTEFTEEVKINGFADHTRTKTGYGVKTNVTATYDFQKQNMNLTSGFLTENRNLYNDRSNIKCSLKVLNELVDSHIDEAYDRNNTETTVPLEKEHFTTYSNTSRFGEKNQFVFPHIYVEKGTGKLYTRKQAEQENARTIDGMNKLYLPIWCKLGKYDTEFRINPIGVNRTKISLVKTIDAYAYMYAHQNSDTRAEDELLLEPVYPDSDKPKGWTKKELEWLNE